MFSINRCRQVLKRAARRDIDKSIFYKKMTLTSLFVGSFRIMGYTSNMNKSGKCKLAILCAEI
jgi:hypothetical protein